MRDCSRVRYTRPPKHISYVFYSCIGSFAKPGLVCRPVQLPLVVTVELDPAAFVVVPAVVVAEVELASVDIDVWC